MIALAVYAAVATVLLIVALCSLLLFVKEQKEIVRRATDARMAKAVEAGALTPNQVRAAERARPEPPAA